MRENGPCEFFKLDHPSSNAIQTATVGAATLILGDALRVFPALGGVDHVISDPPYESVMHAAKAAASKRRLRIDGGPEIAALDFDGVDAIRQPVADMVAAECRGWALLFCSPEGVGRWADAINATPARYKRACVWVKPDSAPQFNGQGPAMGAENFVAVWCGRGFARWNAGGKRGVYTHQTNPRDRDGRHPTEKPWRLMAELVADFTAPGDVVCDPFMGSGSTGIACLRLGRRFIGIERDPRYFEVAVDRIHQIAATGDLFVPAVAPRQEPLNLLYGNDFEDDRKGTE